MTTDIYVSEIPGNVDTWIQIEVETLVVFVCVLSLNLIISLFIKPGVQHRDEILKNVVLRANIPDVEVYDEDKEKEMILQNLENVVKKTVLHVVTEEEIENHTSNSNRDKPVIHRNYLHSRKLMLVSNMAPV